MKQMATCVLVTVLVALVAVSALGQGEMLSNPGFESWTVNGPSGPPDNWTIYPTTSFSATQEATTVHGGTYSVNLTWTTTSNRDFEQVDIPVMADSAYTFSAWVYDNDPAGRVAIYIRWEDSGGSWISNSTFVYSSDNASWQQLTTGSQTAPTNAAQCEVRIRCYDVSGNWDGDATVYVDDASLTGAVPVVPTPHTIYEIQYTTDPSGDSPYKDSLVVTSGIVTAGSGTFSAGYFIQDGVGAWNGVYVFDDANTVAEGDSVTVTGTVSEYYNRTEITSVTKVVINSSGNSLPNPTLITTAAVDTSEEYEGVLIQVRDVIVTNPDLGYGEWEVNDGSGPCRVDDWASYTYSPTLGDSLNVTGVVDYAYGNYKIEPRYDADIELLGDFTPPSVEIAFATGQTGIDVHFDEAVDQSSSENTANYSLTSGLTITGASRDGSDLSIVHLTTGSQTGGLADTLIVNGVADTSNNSMTVPDSSGFRQGFTPISMVQTPGLKANDESQLLNEIVTITGIVTADTSTYSHSYVYIQDGNAAWTGVKAHFNANDWGTLEGDSVTVAGQVLEYYGETEIDAEGIYHVVNSSGHQLPTPIAVQTGDVATGSATAESYEGVLIRVNKAWVTNPDLGYGEWEIYDGSTDSCRVDDAADYSYTPTLNDTLGVIGVLMYSYSNFKIEPRYDADIIPGGVGVRYSTQSKLPGAFSLSQNYPNPFNPVTQISFSLPMKAQVHLAIYNIVGQKVAELVNGELDAGSYRVSWDARSFSSGVYFSRIEAGDYQMTKKMVLLK